MDRPGLRVGRLALTLLFGWALVASPAASSPAGLSRGDLRWLSRVTFGIDNATIAEYKRLGREKFLDAQLHPPASDPAELAAEIAAIPVTQQSAEKSVKATRAEQQRINALPTDEAKQQARMALNQAGNQVVYETAKRHLTRALESPAQLREQMTWFWMNHFTVFSGKGNVRWTLADYEEQAIRAHALGKFSDLVLATVTSPAMLEYLDNAQSAAGKINENYARELMELHTLGVSGGPSGSKYTQQDVQELARVLTGVGLNLTDNTPRLPADQKTLYIRRGLFEFNPARHDPAPKTVLGHQVAGHGFAEVEDAVTFLCRQPATARFISSRLAAYFVADDPPAALVDKLTRTFESTDGSIAAVLRDDVPGSRVHRGPGRAVAELEKFKDPMQFVVSSMRMAYDGKTMTNYHPAVAWLQQLGEPLYGRVTPDGYPLNEAAWTSSGQMVRRFEIARAIGSGNAGLFNNGRQQARAGDRISDAHAAAVLRHYRAGPRRRAPARRWPHRVATGMEHRSAVVPRLDAAVGPRSIMKLSRRDVLKLALARRRASAAADPRHRVAGVCGAGRRGREVPAGVPPRRLRRDQRGDSGRQRLLLRVAADAGAAAGRIPPTPTPRSRWRGPTKRPRGACIRRSRTPCCRSGRRVSWRSCRLPAPMT